MNIISSHYFMEQICNALSFHYAISDSCRNLLFYAYNLYKLQNNFDVSHLPDVL